MIGVPDSFRISRIHALGPKDRIRTQMIAQPLRARWSESRRLPSGLWRTHTIMDPDAGLSLGIGSGGLEVLLFTSVTQSGSLHLLHQCN